MKGSIARALAFLTEGVIGPQGAMAPVTVRLKMASIQTKRSN